MENKVKKVLIAGGSGLIGRRLSWLLQDSGYQVAWLSRKPDQKAPYPTYEWNVSRQFVDRKAFEGVAVVINLAGAGIVDKPWTSKRKQVIIDSRVKSTELLLKNIQELNPKPEVYLSGAAIGYYGDRGDEILKEDAPPGKEGFLAESTLLWEEAIQKVRSTKLRTLTFRIGIVLSTKGGALPQMALPVNFGFGVYFDQGNQWYSWIHIDDLCKLFIWAIETQTVTGVYNAVAPAPETNKNFTKLVVKAKGRRSLNFGVPAIGLRWLMGEMADTILGSARVSADKAINEGFEFQFPALEGALKDLFRRKI